MILTTGKIMIACDSDIGKT